jgi:hypothetical protein
MQTVALQPVANQVISVTLNNQSCTIAVQQTDWGMFLDLSVDNVQVIGGVICENTNPVVRSAYLGFVGDLAFFDLQGDTDPVYTGLGSRYVLAYIAPPTAPGSSA